ncbi:hypothetical protein QG37_07976 [Candidozyma auris]|nr:hypothetical protein QG37_07976 [[Candida] auris]
MAGLSFFFFYTFSSFVQAPARAYEAESGRSLSRGRWVEGAGRQEKGWAKTALSGPFLPGKMSIPSRKATFGGTFQRERSNLTNWRPLVCPAGSCQVTFYEHVPLRRGGLAPLRGSRPRLCERGRRPAFKDNAED